MNSARLIIAASRYCGTLAPAKASGKPRRAFFLVEPYHGRLIAVSMPDNTRIGQVIDHMVYAAGLPDMHSGKETQRLDNEQSRPHLPVIFACHDFMLWKPMHALEPMHALDGRLRDNRGAGCIWLNDD
jgi:hypothetical protein